MPTGLTSSTCSNSDQSGCSDFNFLLVQYGIAVNYVGSSNATWSDNGYSNIQNNPIYTTRSGSFRDGSFGGQASDGSLWSGTTGSGTFAYLLSYYSSNVRPALYDNRYYGFPVRCIAQYSSDFGYLLVEQGITSSFGTAAQNTGWNSNGYSNIQKAPLFTTWSGGFDGVSLGGQASDGNLWSGTTRSGTDAYYLYYNSSVVRPANYYNRQYAFPVRCVARHFSYHNQKEKSGHVPVFLFILSSFRWGFSYKKSPKNL